MDAYQVRNRVELILSQARSKRFFIVVRNDSGRAVYFEGDASAPPVALPGAFQMSHEQLQLLRQLYVSLSAELQSIMPTILMGHIAAAPQVVTQALIDLRAMNLLMYLDQSSLEVICEIGTAILDSLTHRADFFNESDLASVGTFAESHLRRGLETANATVDAPPSEGCHMWMRLQGRSSLA
jgi:hypothetical protein